MAENGFYERAVFAQTLIGICAEGGGNLSYKVSARKRDKNWQEFGICISIRP